MLPIYVEQRFQMLLNLAKEVKTIDVARENIVAATEIIDTLFAVQLLTIEESLEYRSLCAAVKVEVERKVSARALPKTYTSFDDGVRAAVKAKEPEEFGSHAEYLAAVMPIKKSTAKHIAEYLEDNQEVLFDVIDELENLGISFELNTTFRSEP